MARRSTDRGLKAVLKKGGYWRPEEAAVVVAAWERSGKPLAVFARAHGLSPVRLGRWRRRLESVKAESVPVFHPVRVTGWVSPEEGGVRSGVELVVGGGRRVRVTRGFDPELLEDLVRVVEGWGC